MTTTVYDMNGATVKLKPTDKHGGQGSIYLTKKKGMCAKIFFADKINPELSQKVSDMIQNPPKDPTLERTGHYSIAWPMSSLYFDQKRTDFAGFMMPYAESESFQESYKYFGQSDRIRRFGGHFTWKHLIIAAYNISNIVASIHERRHCIGDIRESNILISPEAMVTIIDCDSFQILDSKSNKVYYCSVGTGEYLPPDMIGRDFTEEKVSRYHSDLFGLGIIIFKMLMNGFHPFASRGPLVDNLTSTVEKIQKGYFAYEGQIGGIFPPMLAPPYYNVIPPDIRELFHRCFVDGLTNIRVRPEAKEWASILRPYAVQNEE